MCQIQFGLLVQILFKIPQHNFLRRLTVHLSFGLIIQLLTDFKLPSSIFQEIYDGHADFLVMIIKLLHFLNCNKGL